MPRIFRILAFCAFTMPLFTLPVLFSVSSAQAYAVKSGDTPGGIANKHGISTQELLKANPGLDPTKLRVGQEITIPGAKSQEKTAAATPGKDDSASKKPSAAQEKTKAAEEKKAKPAEEKAPASTSGGAYTVQKGDTPQSIAAKMGVSVPDLLKANGDLDPRKLKVGQVLKSPSGAPPKAEKAESRPEAKAEAKKEAAAPAVRHKVKRGETLASIAGRYGTTIEAIQRLNPSTASGKVKTGSQLTIPPGQATAPAAPADKAPPSKAAAEVTDLPEPEPDVAQETPSAQTPPPGDAPAPAVAEPETGSPADAEGYFEKGNELGKQNKYQKAIEQFDRAIKLNPNRADYYASRGHAFYYMKLYTRAIEDYTQAIERNQSFALAYSMRGLSHTRAGHFDKALEDYNKAISLGPKEADYYKGRGYTYFHLKQYGPMCEDYQKACTFGDCELLETARKENLCKAGG